MILCIFAPSVPINVVSCHDIIDKIEKISKISNIPKGG